MALGEEFQRLLRKWGRIPFRKAFLTETEKFDKGIGALDAVFSLFLTAEGQKDRFILWWRVNLSPDQRKQLLDRVKNEVLPRSTFEQLEIFEIPSSSSTSSSSPSPSSLWNCIVALFPEIQDTNELCSGDGSAFLKLFIETVDDFIERSLKSMNLNETDLEDEEQALPRPRAVALACAKREVESLRKLNKKTGRGLEVTKEQIDKLLEDPLYSLDSASLLYLLSTREALDEEDSSTKPGRQQSLTKTLEKFHQNALQKLMVEMILTFLDEEKKKKQEQQQQQVETTRDSQHQQKKTTTTPAPRRLCVNCKQETEKSLRCSRCQSEYYCSKDCQVKAWPSHKSLCKPVNTTNR